MLRPFKFVLFILYNYYNENRNSRSPYFSAITTLVLVLFTNLLTFLRIFKIHSEKIIPWSVNDEYGIQFIKAILFFIPIYLIIIIVFKKDRIVNLEYSNNLVEKGNWLVLAYLVLSFVVFTIVAFAVKL